MRLDLPFETKNIQGNEIVGHGAVFGNVDLGGDVVLPGAFAASIAKHKAEKTAPAMLWQHDHHRPIGVWHEFHEDETGLFLKGEFADTVDGRDAKQLAELGAVNGLSIGFQIDDFDFDREGVRLLKAVHVWETSIVTFPMNPKAAIEAMKADRKEPITTLRDYEAFLHRQFSVREARKLARGGWAALNNTDELEAAQLIRASIKRF